MNIANDLLLKAINGTNTERRPVWLMRQAGRILKEYRDVRRSVSGFIELVKTPELAAEVTLQPVDLLGVDAAIIFSDILVIPEAMGLPYEMIEKKGPYFPNTIKTDKDLSQLKKVNAEDLQYVLDAIKITKRALNNRVPLIGFAGAPWTIFCYMIEGMGSKTFSKARRMLYENPALAHTLLQQITDATITYLKAKIEAGVDVIQLFDSWAGILDQQLYDTFALSYNRQIFEALPEVPKTLFARGAYNTLQSLKTFPAQAIQLDWQTIPEEARKLIGRDKTLQGNLDPAVLYSDFNTIKRKTREMMTRFERSKHIVNLGHGVYPDTNPDNVRCFIETVKAFG